MVNSSCFLVEIPGIPWRSQLCWCLFPDFMSLNPIDSVMRRALELPLIILVNAYKRDIDVNDGIIITAFYTCSSYSCL